MKNFTPYNSPTPRIHSEDNRRFTNVLIRIEDGAVITGIILTVAITFINVIARYIFFTGFGWAEEMIRYIMIWISFIGFSIFVRKKGLIAVDFFVEKVFGNRRNLRRWINRAGHTINLFFSSLLFVSSLLLTINVFQQGQISAGLEIPMGIVYGLLPIACFISALRYLTTLIEGVGDEKRYWA